MEKENIYAKAVKNRVLIMLIILFIITPILLCTGLLVSTYTSNVANPFTVEYTETSIEYLNENKFRINEYYLSTFAVEVDDEPNDEAKSSIYIEIGKTVDKNITSSAVTIKSYTCYNWANFSSTQAQTSLNLSTNGTNTNLTTSFDATFNKRPYFFINIDLQKDAKFLTMFTVKEVIDNVEVEVNYLVKSTFKDLYISGETNLQG